MNTLTITFKTFSLILSALGLFVFGAIFGSVVVAKTSYREPKIVMEPLPPGYIAIDPKQTDCKIDKGLEKNGYLNPSQMNYQMYSVYAGQGKVVPLRAQTVNCTFIDTTGIKTSYPTTLEFSAYTWWFKWKKEKR